MVEHVLLLLGGRGAWNQLKKKKINAPSTSSHMFLPEAYFLSGFGLLKPKAALDCFWSIFLYSLPLIVNNTLELCLFSNESH